MRHPTFAASDLPHLRQAGSAQQPAQARVTLAPAALVFAVVAGALVLGARSTASPDVDRPPPPVAFRLMPQPAPYTALFDPTPASGAIPGIIADSRPLAAIFAARSPAPSAIVATADLPEATPIPLPETAQSPLAQDVPVPMPRPAEFDVPPTRPPFEPASRPIYRPRRMAASPVIPADNRTFLERFFGGEGPPGPQLAYAAPETSVLGSLFGKAEPRQPVAVTPYDRWTAVYDISAHTVYMPDGTRLEAHSGLGERLDDPNHVHERMRGATPPHLYELTPREQLFHGVRALRLTPVGGGGVFGRTGLLAHTFMLGPKGDSNGCVSFRNYDAFLQAFQSGTVRRLAVVARQI